MKQLSIIGLSKSGKTCYIYAMAQSMIRGYEGLNIIASDNDLRLKLDLGWRTICSQNTWLNGTDQVTKCTFNCLLNLSPVMEFCWEDFEGGALTSFNEVSTRFREEFDQYLRESDGLIVFTPSDVIQDILENRNNSVALKNDLGVLMQMFLANIDTLRNIPVTVLITKSDLLTTRVEKEYGIDLIKAIFDPLFRIGNKMKVLVVPVSLGVNLGRGQQGQEVHGDLYGNPNDGNIHIPIVFYLYHFLKDCILVEKNELGTLNQKEESRYLELRKVESHNGLQRWWNYEDPDEIRNNIGLIGDEKKRKSEKIAQLEKDLEKVTNLFTGNCQYYIDGQLVEF